MRRVLLAGTLTAISDGLFSSVLSALFYGSTVARLWQGVAAVLLGPVALQSDSAIAVGIAMHIGVAFAWSIVFWVALRMNWLRQWLNSPLGPFTVAAVYGPLIWVAMSLVVIPAFTHRPTSITGRWWIQFFGHMVFVGLPLVYSFRAREPRAAAGTEYRVTTRQ